MIDKGLDWWEEFYGGGIDTLKNFIESDTPNILITGKYEQNLPLIAESFIKEIISEKGGVYKSVYCSDPVTAEERSQAKSSARASAKLRGGEMKLVNPFIEMRVRSFIENTSVSFSMRYLILYDFDKLGNEQEAFRRIMEKYSNVCRFILVGDIDGIIEPIISRCVVIRIPKISREDFTAALENLVDEKFPQLRGYKSFSELYQLTDGNLAESLFIIMIAVSKYRSVNPRIYRMIWKKSGLLSIINKILSMKIKSAIADLERYVSSNSLDWHEFAAAFSRRVITSTMPNKEKVIMLLSDLDGKYGGENPFYYIVYFLLKIKEMNKK